MSWNMGQGHGKQVKATTQSSRQSDRSKNINSQWWWRRYCINEQCLPQNHDHLHCVSEKMHQLWSGIAQNYKDRFWWYLAEIFKRLYNSVYVFQFSCRFAFINFSSFKPDTENNANFDTVSSKRGNFDEVQLLKQSWHVCLIQRQNSRYKPTWTLKHANSVLDISAKCHQNTVSKLVQFFRDTVCVGRTGRPTSPRCSWMVSFPSGWSSRRRPSPSHRRHTDSWGSCRSPGSWPHRRPPRRSRTPHGRPDPATAATTSHSHRLMLVTHAQETGTRNLHQIWLDCTWFNVPTNTV